MPEDLTPEEAVSRLKDPALAEAARRLLAAFRAAREPAQQSTPPPKGEVSPLPPSREESVGGLEELKRHVELLTVARPEEPPPIRRDPFLLAREAVGRLLEEALAEDPENRPLRELHQLFREKGLFGPLRLLALLQLLARLHLRERHGPEAPKKASQALFHLPLDLVAAHLEVHRVTVWRWYRELEEAGLLRAWTHRGSLGGRTRATGTLWAVRLRPGRVRLYPEEFRHPWRDLERDRAEGRTAYRALYPEGKEGERRRPPFSLLLRWALGERVLPPEGEALLALLRSPRLEDLHLLPLLRGGARTALLEALADRAVALFGDPHSRRFYTGLFWKVAKGELPPAFLLGAMRQALEGRPEVHRPGALLASLLRDALSPAAA
jgi:hypothetical protein